jgi:hypothetical protein
VIAKCALAACILAGCVAQIGGADHAVSRDAAEAPDAAPPTIDAPPSDAAIDAPACSRVVFLNFDGDTLARSPEGDARADAAAWVGLSTGQSSATMAEWRPTATDRTSQIAEVVAELEARFATIVPNMQFVTTRPTGSYIMIGFGGSMQAAGVPYTGAVATLDCGDANKNDVAWIFESTTNPTQVVNYAAGAIAFGMGATGTTSSTDCMCGWLTDCEPSGAACTFSSTANAQLACAGETDPQDDVGLLQTFCN